LEAVNDWQVVSTATALKHTLREDAHTDLGLAEFEYPDATHPETPTVFPILDGTGNAKLSDLPVVARLFADYSITFGPNATIKRMSKKSSNLQHWLIEDPLSTTSSGSRQFTIDWDKTPPAPTSPTPRKLVVKEYPHLSRADTAEFNFDFRGLPPVTLTENDFGVVADGDAAALQAALDAGSMPEAVCANLEALLRKFVPFTEFSLTASTTPVVDEDGARWTVPISGNRHWAFITIRRVNAELQIDPPGFSRRYGAKAATPADVLALRADLIAMGFQFIPPTGDHIDDKVRYAIREFQVYAQRAMVASTLGGTLHAVAVPEELRYRGPLSGKLDNATRAAIDVWRSKTRLYCCPVVITELDGSNATVHDNVWDPTSIPATNHLTVMDYSRGVTTPLDRP
jgi:hypothetical protein